MEGDSKAFTGDVKTMFVIVLVVLLLALGAWIFTSAMEARAYNRATGSDVSTWDAMWIELRVQAGPKQ